MKKTNAQIRCGDGYVLGGHTKEAFATAWRETLETDPNAWTRAVAGLEEAEISTSVLYRLVSKDSDLSFVRLEDMIKIARAAGLCLEMIFEMGDHMRK